MSCGCAERAKRLHEKMGYEPHPTRHALVHRETGREVAVADLERYHARETAKSLVDLLRKGKK